MATEHGLLGGRFWHGDDEARPAAPWSTEAGRGIGLGKGADHWPGGWFGWWSREGGFHDRGRRTAAANGVEDHQEQEGAEYSRGDEDGKRKG